MTKGKKSLSIGHHHTVYVPDNYEDGDEFAEITYGLPASPGFAGQGRAKALLKVDKNTGRLDYRLTEKEVVRPVTRGESLHEGYDSVPRRWPEDVRVEWHDGNCRRTRQVENPGNGEHEPSFSWFK